MSRRSLVAILAAVLGAVGFAVPVKAAVPDVWAFAYSDTAAPPLPDWPMDPARQAGTYSTTCPDESATVTALGTGVYEVRFPCSAAEAGVVHVTAVNATGGFCEAGPWRAVGADEVVTVFCFDAAGAPAWGRFAVVFMQSSGTASPRLHAYAHADAAGTLRTGFNSTGGTVGAMSFGAGTGRYRIELGGLNGGSLAGDLQVTAVDDNGAPRHCAIADWAGSGASYLAYVQCFDERGRPVDTAFTLSYHHKATVYGAPPTKATPLAYLLGPLPVSLPDTSYNSAGGTNVLVGSGPGHYDLTFGQAAAGGATHVQVSTFSNLFVYCVLTGVPPWLVAAPDVAVDVDCYRTGGTRAPASFFTTYASAA